MTLNAELLFKTQTESISEEEAACIIARHLIGLTQLQPLAAYSLPNGSRLNR